MTHRPIGKEIAARIAGRAGRTSPALVVGLVLGMVLLAGAVMLALVKFVGTEPQPAATRPADAGPRAVVLAGPAIATTAADMRALFKERPADAEAKYTGKVVDVDGTVFAKGTDLAGERAVTLEGGGQARFAGVRCVFPNTNYFQWDQVEVGQAVRVRGRCDGLVSDVVLRDCAVLPAEK